MATSVVLGFFQAPSTSRTSPSPGTGTWRVYREGLRGFDSKPFSWGIGTCTSGNVSAPSKLLFVRWLVVGKHFVFLLGVVVEIQIHLTARIENCLLPFQRQPSFFGVISGNSVAPPDGLQP